MSSQEGQGAEKRQVRKAYRMIGKTISMQTEVIFRSDFEPREPEPNEEAAANLLFEPFFGEFKFRPAK